MFTVCKRLNNFFSFKHTIDMKKSVLILLTLLTIGTVTVCGCGNTMKNDGFNTRIDTNGMQIQSIDEDEQPNPECPDGECPGDECPECPDGDEHDRKFPTPRKPHKRHNKKLPHSKSVHRN